MATAKGKVTKQSVKMDLKKALEILSGGSSKGLPADLVAELNAADLAWRFINATRYKVNGSVDSRGYVPYIAKNKNISGVNSEGLYIIKDTILATIPVAESKKRQAAKDFMTQIYNQQQKTAGAESMRELAKSHSVDTEIDETYE